MTYEQNRVRQPVSLHKVKDADILTHIKEKEFSTYVKKLIREDMKKWKQMSLLKSLGGKNPKWQ